MTNFADYLKVMTLSEAYSRGITKCGHEPELQDKSDFARECITDRLCVRKENFEGTFDNIPLPISTRFLPGVIAYNGFTCNNITIKTTN